MIRSSSYEKRLPKNSEFSADIMQITFPNKGLSNTVVCKVLCKYLCLYFATTDDELFNVRGNFESDRYIVSISFFAQSFSSTSFLFHLKKPIGIDLNNLQRLRVKIFPTLFFCSMKMPQKHSCCSKNKVNLLKFSQQCNWAVNSIFQPLSVHSMKLHMIMIKFMLPQNKSIFTKK